MARISQITDKLFISSYRAAKKQRKLKEAGIDAVVNLMEEEKYGLPEEYSYLFKPLEDETYVSHEDLEEILAFIAAHLRNGEKVLVHCHSGISRSGGIVVAILLMEHPEWTWGDALQRARHITLISPHDEIKRSILDYLESKEGTRRE